MAGYFAELQNNIVQRVVSATDMEWCVDNLGGEWVQTYYSTEGKNYAGIGYTYNPLTNNFIPPRPYPSWNLDESENWVPPVAFPRDGNMYIWDEETGDWIINNLL